MEMPELDGENIARFCFACSQENPVGLKLKPVQVGDKVTADFTAGKFHQGWDNVIHGGILYTLLDEVNAYAMLCKGIELGVTAKSEIKFKHTAPINETIKASAWVTKLTKRLVETEGVITLKDETVIAEGSFLYFVLRQSRKTILWDMDGVIADSYHLHFAAWQEILSKRGIDFTEKSFYQLFGTRNDFIVKKFIGNDLSEKDVKIILKEKEENFRQRATGNIQPFPGVIRLLHDMKKSNLKLGLVSSAPKDNIDLVLNEFNIIDVFDCVVSGQEVLESKPNPQIYLLTAEKMGVLPKDCLAIEDSALGVQAARNAGMKCLAITNTQPKQNLKEANKIVESLENVDLITLLMRI